MNISKELLSDVFNSKVSKVYGNKERLHIDTDRGYVGINIHELNSLLKDWAHNQPGVLIVGTLKGKDGKWCTWFYNFQAQEESCGSDTEIESVVKACEWLLDKKNKEGDNGND